MTPAMAPEAPTRGTVESWLSSTKPAVATNPAARYRIKKPALPKASSTLLPKIQKLHMLNPMWRMLPWRNIETRPAK